MTTIETTYAKAKDAHSKCINGTLRHGEAKEIVSNLWSELYAAFQENSNQWRIVDKSRKEHTDWWSVPTMSNYVKPSDAHNINIVIQVIERITGKTAKQPVAPQTKIVVEKPIKNRKSWLIISKHWDSYKLAMVFLMALGIIVTIILHIDNKGEKTNDKNNQPEVISNVATHQ